MRRRGVDLWSPAIGASGAVIAYGHWGRPVLAFPAEAGHAGDFESRGMVDAVADLARGGSRACSRRRASRTSWTCGDTTSRTTGRGGGASWHTTCTARPDEGEGPLNRHLIGLLLGDFRGLVGLWVRDEKAASALPSCPPSRQATH
jgi:hypothetical protein